MEAGYHSLLTGEGDHTSDDADNSSGSDSDSNSTGTMNFILKPTRSGRVPKQKGMPNRQVAATPKITLIRLNTLIFRVILPQLPTSPPANEENTTAITIQENKDKIAPGAIMIIASPNQPGAPMYNIYMVTI